MNTKFERDNYGLRLNCIAANDNERALLTELFDLQVNNAAKRGLVVTAYPEQNTLTIHRPTQYINHQAILYLGFSGVVVSVNRSLSNIHNVFCLISNNKFFLLRGSGVYTLYVFDRIPPFLPYSCHVEGSGFSLTSIDGVALYGLNFSQAKSIFRHIRIKSELKDILKGIIG